MPDSPEFELIAKFKAGDVSVFNLLTRRWYEKILGFLYRVLGNMEDAEDACQKTFITVYTRLHQLNEPAKFRSWLYRIANNNAMDLLNDRKHIARSRTNGESEDPHIDLDGPDTEAADLESRIDLVGLHILFEKIMLSIPEEQRVVIVMKLYQDMKFSEIAETLNVPLNTVKTRMYSGLRAMKDSLARNKLIEEILKDAM